MSLVKSDMQFVRSKICETYGYDCCVDITKWKWMLQKRGQIRRKICVWDIENYKPASLWNVIVQHANGTAGQPFAAN